jgi:hypothetical protein
VTTPVIPRTGTTVCWSCGGSFNVAVIWKCAIAGRKRPLCERCWLNWTDGLFWRTMPPRLRALDADDAARAWAGQYSVIDYAPYVEDVKTMRANTSYEIVPDPGVTPQSVRRRLDYAAHQVGVRLKWLHHPKKSPDRRLICKLADDEQRSNGRASHADSVPQALVAKSGF